MLQSPYFRRLFLPYLALILAGTLAAGFLGAAQIRKTYYERTRQALLDETTLIRALLQDLPADDAAALRTFVDDWSGRLHRRLTVIAADGQVLADSTSDPALMDDHSTRPEVRQAAAEEFGLSIRRSATLHQNLMYLALPLREKYAGFVRLSLPVDSVDRNVAALYRQLAGGALLAFCAVVLICYVITRRLTRPLLNLVRAVDNMSGGDLRQQVEVSSDDEMGILAEAFNRLGKSLRGLVEQVSADRTELRAILGSLVEGVIAVDHLGIIKFVNPAASRLFQLQQDHAEGQRLNDVLAHDEVLALTAQVRHSRQPARTRLGPSPNALHLDIVVCPVAAEQGYGAVLLAHDAAESHRYQELRSEFIANVSHELRTPLTFIGGFLETLRAGAVEDPHKRDEFLERIARNANQLKNLVNDLLDLSELQERPGNGREESTDLNETLRQLCDQFRPAAELKHQRLTLDLPPSPILAWGRSHDLERAFSNLIDNAIKYSADGGWITVRATADGPLAEISVTDTGSGIPAEDLPRVFERFYRVDKSRSRAMGGTGLGLAIAKHVIEAHGGTIGISSKPGQGSRFTVELPCHQPETAPLDQPPATA